MAALLSRRARCPVTSPTFDCPYKLWEQILVWHEKKIAHRTGDCLGPYVIASADYVRDIPSGPARPFGSARVKPHVSPELLASNFVSNLCFDLRQLAPSCIDSIVSVFDRNGTF